MTFWSGRAVAVWVAAAALGCLPAGAAAAAAPAAAAGSICVGLVVDAASIGAGTSSGCVKVPAGSTGLQVLEAGGHQVTMRDNGAFVCAIDGQPADGCNGTDASHYWSYWHRAAGSSAWHFSAQGAGEYAPDAGSTEGWVYDDGSDERPPAVAQLCPTPARPSPRPTRTPRATGPAPRHRTDRPPRHPAATSPAVAAPPGASTPAAPVSSPPAKRPPTRPPTAGSRHAARPPGRRGRPHARGHRARPPVSPTPPPLAPTAVRPAAATQQERPAGGGTPLWALLTVGAGAAALGGAAWWRSRRSAGAG